MTEEVSKCGFIAIVGRPNVGKSTLLNVLLQKKISITSDKPQTTRSQVLGIKTVGLVQEVYIDTPGIHHTEKRAINRYMNRLASSVIGDADVIVFMIDATRWQVDDDLILEKIKHTKASVILAINKIDKLKNKALLFPLIEKLQAKFNFTHIIPLSAANSENVSVLEKEIILLLPEGPHLFPDEQITDKTERFQVSELIREKIIRVTSEEIPYSVNVEIESFKDEEKLLSISAVIWVEREGQKPIIIGVGGASLKAVGTQARKDMERLFNKKVFLRLWVKVKDNWTDDERILKSLGYE